MEDTKQKFEKAYIEYSPGILKHIYLRVSDWNVAKDITQDTFFKAWRSISQGNTSEIRNYKAFFYRIANNNIIDYYRKRKDISLDEKEETEIENIAVVEAEQGNDFDQKIEKDKLDSCLSELKDEYKQVLIMRYVNDLSIEEISQIINKGKGNVRILLYRAMQVLKKKYGQ